jgi:predicted MFS family arabinose efflux permease
VTDARGGWIGFYRRVLARRRGDEPGGLDLRLVTLAMTLTVACTMPLWLLGALSVQMRAELDYSLVALGGAVALQRLGGAVLSLPFGRLADRWGPTPAMRVAALMAAVAAFGIAALATEYWILAVFLLFSGGANALGQTAANLALVRAVPYTRQGTAFGIKQSALPVGSMVAGLTVPLLALTIGWRYAFVLAGLVSLIVLVWVPRGRSEQYRRPAGVTNRVRGRGPLLVLAVGLFFGMAAATGLTTFIVEAATDAGVSPAQAGLLLTLGSICSIITRLVAGRLADRRGGRHLITVARMQLTGMFGLALIATGRPTLMVVGAIVAFSFAWGFNGVFWFAIVRLSPATPAAASGTVMPGGMLGGVAGPLLFGWVVQTFGFAPAWLTAASWSLMAGLLMLLGRRLLRASLEAGDIAQATAMAEPSGPVERSS